MFFFSFLISTAAASDRSVLAEACAVEYEAMDPSVRPRDFQTYLYICVMDKEGQEREARINELETKSVEASEPDVVYIEVPVEVESNTGSFDTGMDSYVQPSPGYVLVEDSQWFMSKRSSDASYTYLEVFDLPGGAFKWMDARSGLVVYESGCGGYYVPTSRSSSFVQIYADLDGDGKIDTDWYGQPLVYWAVDSTKGDVYLDAEPGCGVTATWVGKTRAHVDVGVGALFPTYGYPVTTTLVSGDFPPGGRRVSARHGQQMN